MNANITIKEVAKKAGVGIATVSRVLNNSERVDPDTRARVLAVIRKLKYRPNVQGRRLVKRSSEVVCFLLCNRDFINPFHMTILNSTERYLSQVAQDVIFANLHYDTAIPAERLVLPHILTHRGVADGVILSGTIHANLIDAIQALAVPCVFFGNNIISHDECDAKHERADTVYFEETAACRAETEMLLKLGHRRILFVGDTRMPWFARRFQGFQQAMDLYGAQPFTFTEPCTTDYRDYGLVYGEQAMEQMVRNGGNRITAVVAGNDGIAFGVWKALHRHGLRMPEDISVAGFDDVLEARLAEPPLTTVHVATEQIGGECAEMLLRKLADGGKPQAPRVIASYLVERGSCAPPSPEVRRAKAVSGTAVSGR